MSYQSTFAVILSIGKTRYFLRKTTQYKIAQSLFTLIENHSDIASAFIGNSAPESQQLPVSVSVSRIGPDDKATLWPHRLGLMTAVMEAELMPRFETMIDGECVRDHA